MRLGSDSCRPAGKVDYFIKSIGTVFCSIMSSVLNNLSIPRFTPAFRTCPIIKRETTGIVTLIPARRIDGWRQ
jgi:hypothetical protein